MKYRIYVCENGGYVCIQNAAIPGNLAQAWILLRYPGREGALLSPPQREWFVFKTEQAKERLIFKTDQVKNSGWVDLLQTASLPQGLKDMENCV